jgi:hypothetical protein
MRRGDIKRIFLANRFKEKDQGNGVMDLNPYVYEAADALLREAMPGDFWLSLGILMGFASRPEHRGDPDVEQALGAMITFLQKNNIVQ